MKIAKQKNNNNKNIIAIAVAAIAVVLAIVLIIVLIPSRDKKGNGKNDVPKVTTTTTQGTAKIKELVVESLPSKTTYYVGEEFDPTGIKIKVVTTKASTDYYIDATDAELTFTGFDSSSVNESLTVYANYKGYKASFTVSVELVPTVVEGTATGISVAYVSKSIYYLGDSFDPSGVKLAVTIAENDTVYYINGDHSGVEFSGFDSSVVNDELSIKVSYKGFTTTYTVAVKDPSFAEYVILSLTIASSPRTIYYIGQQFDITGLRVQVNTDKQATTFFVEADDPKLEITGFDSSVACENQVITVTYEGVSTKFTVTIKEYPTAAPKLESIEVVGLTTTYTLADWQDGISIKNVTLKLVYDNGTTEEIPMKWNYVDPTEVMTAPGTTNFVVNYGGKTTTVVITITE